MKNNNNLENSTKPNQNITLNLFDQRAVNFVEFIILCQNFGNLIDEKSLNDNT